MFLQSGVSSVKQNQKTHSYTQTIRERELYNFRCVNIRYNTRVCVRVCILFRYIRRSLIICSNLKKFGCCIFYFVVANFDQNLSFFNNFQNIYIIYL